MNDELTPEQLHKRFAELIVPYLHKQQSSDAGGHSWPPVVVYVGGQPGAGKSRANERAARGRPSLVPVIGDDFRQFHPAYSRLMREDPLSMPSVTARASGQWIGMSAAYLREQRADVLIETTLRSPEAMAATIGDFREAQYVVELRVVAVPHEVSRLSTLERYLGQVEQVGAGRWTSSAAHDEAFAAAPATVEHLVARGAVDRVVIEDRTGEVLFDRSYLGDRDDGLRRAGRKAGLAVESARSVERMTPDGARAWLDLARAQCVKLSDLQVATSADLLATVERLVTRDAYAVAARAYPRDPARVNMAVNALRAGTDRLGLEIAKLRGLLSPSTPVQVGRDKLGGTGGDGAGIRRAGRRPKWKRRGL